MSYRFAAFDFDGTLADSFGFFVASYDTLARKHGFAGLDHAKLEEYRGLEARELLRLHGVPMWKVPVIARDFLAMMARDGAAIRPFAGIGDELRKLSERGVGLAIVTSNSRENVSRVLGDEVMARIGWLECGVSLFGKRRRIERALRAAGARADASIYVGDQSNDGEAALEAGVAFGAVHWGYATGESLERFAPALRFRAVSDLALIAA